jgi:hypothetical protein
MKTVSDLLAATDQFFSRHWSTAAVGCEPPGWAPWQSFLLGSVPNHDKAGCYALFVGEELVYVGVGASKGGGIYDNHGLSRRLMAHVIRADRSKNGDWSQLCEPWLDVTGLYTIGFAHPQAYLSPALESFLIREFRSQLRNQKV